MARLGLSRRVHRGVLVDARRDSLRPVPLHGSHRGARVLHLERALLRSAFLSFLAYASYCLARWALRQSRGWPTVVLAGVLMTGLDVVIDPLAVRGDRWFLGHVFHYAEPGVYFGVPLSNFAGWALVGVLIVGGYLWGFGRRAEPRSSAKGGIGLYYGVLCFNLATTGMIGEWPLLGAGILVHVAAILLIYRLRVLRSTRAWKGAPRHGAAAPSPTTLTDKGRL